MASKDHNISITDVKEIIHSCLNYIATDSPREEWAKILTEIKLH